MARPRAILLTGAPGSGKSTLGRELAQHLRLPFIARDDIRGGLLFSAGAWGEQLDSVPPSDEAVEIFLATVEGLLTNGVSCVIEYVMRHGRPEDFDRIAAASDCVVVMTNCEAPMERVRTRNMTDPLIANEAVLSALGFASVDDHTEAVVARMQAVQQEMRVTFPVPVLQVDTTSSYVPALTEVLAFITGPRNVSPAAG